MHVLAADTTTPRGSVAVVSEAGVLAEARVATSEGHSRWLLPAVDTLLRGLGLAPAALGAFAVTTGPGSFTGLRVGLASVQGLALACGRPCVGLSALDVLALAASLGKIPAVRVSLGATRWRIVRQLLVESLLIAAIAGALGFWLSKVGVAAFDRGVSGTGKPYWIVFTMDYTVFGYLAAICVLPDVCS